MFNISGPLPVTPNQRPDESALILRLNQRIVAEVMQVSGENVVLAIDGVRFVAKLTTADQANALQERRFAQFIVRDITSNQVVIQIAPSPGSTPAAAIPTQDLAGALLSQMGIPVNESNLTLLRAMLARGLPVDYSTLNELQTALNGLGNWGSAEAQAAAALKAAGLPLTPATLSLILNAPPEVSQAYTRLASLLQGLSPRQVTPQAAEALQRALAFLRQASPEWTGKSSAMAESLRQAISMLGDPVESGLAEHLLKGGLRLPSGEDAKGLLSLVALRSELARSGPREVVEAIDRFLESVRLQQFQSSEPAPTPGSGNWINLHLPLHLAPQDPANQRNSNCYEARIRIACQGEGENRRADPNFTRFVISVDLDSSSTIEVDLSVVERKIGMQVLATSSELCNLAKEELAAFTQGLNELGFDLQTSRFEIGQPREPLDRNRSEISPEKFVAIDLEV